MQRTFNFLSICHQRSLALLTPMHTIQFRFHLNISYLLSLKFKMINLTRENVTESNEHCETARSDF